MKKDEFILASAGVYSDYSILGLFIVLKDFSLEDEIAEYDLIAAKEKYKWRKGEHWKDSRFRLRLQEKGLLQRLPWKELTAEYAGKNEFRVYDHSLSEENEYYGW